MKTYLAYDTNGRIFYQVSGDYTPLAGIPALEVEIPPGKSVVEIDTTATPHKPVYEELSKTELELLTEKVEALEGQIEQLKRGA